MSGALRDRSPAGRYDTDPPKRRLSGHAFARGLRALRQRCGGTQAHEADLAGVPWTTWHRWETCAVQAPVAKLEAVAKWWGVALGDLLAEPSPARLVQVELEHAVRALAAEHGIAAVRRAVRALGR